MRLTLLVGSLLLAAATVATATPLVCDDPCTIETRTVGYILPVTEIASGTSVVWDTQDITHPQTETSLTGTGDACFLAPAQPGTPSDPVRFDLADGVLTATMGTETRVCTNAVVAGDAAVLNYHCTLHPNMHGALVVTAE